LFELIHAFKKEKLANNTFGKNKSDFYEIVCELKEESECS